MRGLLNPDSPVMNFITRIVYSTYLNILWAVCCIPLVTAGAATTALFSVTQRIVGNEEGHLTAQFFAAFRENFKQSTIVWIILVVLGAVLGVDGYVLYHLCFDNAGWTLITAIYFVALAAYAIVLMYIFPLMAHFENTIAAMFKNSIMIGMRFLLCTALMAVVYFAMALVIVRFFTPAVIFGEGLCALICSYLLRNILILCENRAEDAETAE